MRSSVRKWRMAWDSETALLECGDRVMVHAGEQSRRNPKRTFISIVNDCHLAWVRRHGYDVALVRGDEGMLLTQVLPIQQVAREVVRIKRLETVRSGTTEEGPKDG